MGTEGNDREPRSASEFLPPHAREQVKAAIARAERNTSGEIRIHVDDRCEDEVLEHAALVFEELGMQRTKARNGVLIYISVLDHRLAVIGDQGINAAVPEGFWTDVVAALRIQFAAGKRVEGLVHAVELIGEKLGKHFPYEQGDRNELSNEISFGR
ncbi:MAG: TPM domain-containing protein [Flavobacteriales bacterium]|nr:TPM domain-containing protein [Flavobacteriales bacterium]